MTDNLFTANAAPATPEQVPAIDPLLATITDETGKPKYASVEVALKALQNAQSHIKNIETENAQLREATAKAQTLEEVLKAIKTPESAPAAPAVPSKETDPVDIANLVQQTVTKLELEKQATANINSVVEKMKKVYGETAGEQFYKKAGELGFDAQDINSLARKNPSAVFKLFGIEDKMPTKVPQGSIRTDAFTETSQPQKQRSGMAHGDTQQLVDAWRASANKVNERLGIK